MVYRFEAWLWRLVGRMNFRSSNATELRRGVFSYIRLPGIVVNGIRRGHVQLANDGTLQPGTSEDQTCILQVPRRAPFPSATSYLTVLGQDAVRIENDDDSILAIPLGCWAVFVAVNDAYGEETAWGQRYENVNGTLSVAAISEKDCWPVVDQKVSDGLPSFA